MKKKLEQGITDFREFISKSCYFVDKTRLIAYLIDHPSKVHLITRPRRFGKTLNLSMIRYFFEAPFPGGKLPSNASLFDGMSILNHLQCREYLGQYPVIHLSFKDVKTSSFNDCMDLVREMLSAEYHRHAYLQNCNILRDSEEELFARILDRKGSNQDCASSIKHLSFWLKRAYDKPAYILLDEYDTPLHSAYIGTYYDEMIRFIRSFMVQTFKDNPNLQQAVVIGILKIAQESIFSDFNNPAVSTIVDPIMEDAFGFTEQDVIAMASHFGLESEMKGIQEWYNGYIFGNDTVIYNPWSIVNYLRQPSAGMRPYWINTSDNAIIQKVLSLNTRDGRETLEKLLAGEEVRKEIISSMAYPQLETRQNTVWSFLLHSGYLKASERQQHEDFQDYRLEIPNREIRYIYRNIIGQWLEEDLKVNESFQDFIRGIREVNLHLIERGLKRILFGLASYYDMARDEEDRRENFYHGLVLGLLASLDSRYMLDSNREYGSGRPDIVLVRKGTDFQASETAFIFEFKQQSVSDASDLNLLAEQAFKQADRKYIEGVQEKWHPKELLLLGIGFCGKELALYYEAAKK